MGVYVVGAGLRHNLPVGDARCVAERLLPLCGGDVSIGYEVDWIYDAKRGVISDGDYSWRELVVVRNAQRHGRSGRFEIKDFCARQIYEAIGGRIDEVRFAKEEWREVFMGHIMEPYAVYELWNDEPGCTEMRVFKENVDFWVDEPSGFCELEALFREPYEGSAREAVDRLRQGVYRVLQVTGCKVAYLFPDEYFGENLWNELHRPAAEWVDYLETGRFLEGCRRDEEPMIFDIEAYVAGRAMHAPDGCAHCYVDRFGDFD